jgi:hypothetical protein
LPIRATDKHRLGSGARLKATDARNLPKPVKVALRTSDKVAQTQDEMLSWIKNLNPGLDTENWRVLCKHSEPKFQRLILHIDRDSLVAIQKTGCKIFRGLSQGTVKVPRDPEVQKEEIAPNITSSESVSEGEGMERSPPRRTEEEQQMQERKFLLTSNLPQQIRGPL